MASFDALGNRTLSTSEVLNKSTETSGVDWRCRSGFVRIVEFVVFGVSCRYRTGCCSYCLGDSNLERYERLNLGRCGRA